MQCCCDSQAGRLRLPDPAQVDELEQAADVAVGGVWQDESDRLTGGVGQRPMVRELESGGGDVRTFGLCCSKKFSLRHIAIILLFEFDGGTPKSKSTTPRSLLRWPWDSLYYLYAS